MRKIKKSKTTKKVLVVVAHPDDEVLGAGGAIIKHIQAKDDVYIVVLADGVTSRVYQSNISRGKELQKHKDIVAVRRNEFFRAIKIMGVKRQNCYWFGFPDQRLDILPLLDVVKPIEQIAAKFIFDVIYTHHWGDLNKDHRVCCESVLTAFRPSRQIGKKTSMLCFEISGNMNVLPPQSTNKFQPDCFVDITPHISTKMKALRTYNSELRSYPNPTSPQSVLELSKARARTKKYMHAEAFERLK